MIAAFLHLILAAITIFAITTGLVLAVPFLLIIGLVFAFPLWLFGGHKLRSILMLLGLGALVYHFTHRHRAIGSPRNPPVINI